MKVNCSMCGWSQLKEFPFKTTDAKGNKIMGEILQKHYLFKHAINIPGFDAKKVFKE